MSRHKELYAWYQVLQAHLGHLTRPQLKVLALWSFGMILACSCSLIAVTLFLAIILDQKENTVRQRLREWYYDATDKRGDKRWATGMD